MHDDNDNAEMPMMNDFDIHNTPCEIFADTLDHLNCAMCSQNPTENNRNDKQSATSLTTKTA
jgi:hypothetical protein